MKKAKRKTRQQVVLEVKDRQKDNEVVNVEFRYTLFTSEEAYMFEAQCTRKQLREMQRADAQSQLFLNYIREFKD